jgi:hypothetical protein
MNKRIRYTKTSAPNVLRSKRNFIGQQNAQYQVKVNTEEMTYVITNVTTKRILRSTEKDGKKPPKNVYTVFQQVKRALKTLGVEFEHEFRQLEGKENIDTKES